MQLCEGDAASARNTEPSTLAFRHEGGGGEYLLFAFAC